MCSNAVNVYINVTYLQRRWHLGLLKVVYLYECGDVTDIRCVNCGETCRHSNLFATEMASRVIESCLSL